MSEDRNKILSRGKKLYELATRGIGGEMENAKVMLGAYMKKHNLTEDELKSYSQPPNYDLSNMSDEDFMKEMLKELIPVGLAVIFGKYANEETKAQTNAQASLFVNKFLDGILARVEKMNNKYRKQ